MNTRTKATNLTLSPAIDEYVEKRLDKISKLLNDDASIKCDIELAKTSAHHNKGDIFRAEIHIVGPGTNVYASADKSDLYMAVDEVADEALRGLKSTKKKYLSFVRRGGAQVKSMVKGLWPWKK